MLFNEPKLLKSDYYLVALRRNFVSVLFNEPKLLKSMSAKYMPQISQLVSVLFNEPKLLKSQTPAPFRLPRHPFQCSSTSRNC